MESFRTYLLAGHVRSEKAADYYVYWVTRFYRHCGLAPGAPAGPQEIEAYRESVQSPREFYCWMLTLDFGINSARANVEWVEEVIQRIRSGEIPVG